MEVSSGFVRNIRQLQHYFNGINRKAERSAKLRLRVPH